MIDEKKIGEAIDKKYGPASNVTDCLKKAAFVQGAHWAIEQFLKDLWHDVSEEPVNGDILAESIYTSNKFSRKCYSVENMSDIDIIYYDWNEYVEQNCTTRWLCIDDLLEKKGGSDD